MNKVIRLTKTPQSNISNQSIKVYLRTNDKEKINELKLNKGNKMKSYIPNDMKMKMNKNIHNNQQHNHHYYHSQELISPTESINKKSISKSKNMYDLRKKKDTEVISCLNSNTQFDYLNNEEIDVKLKYTLKTLNLYQYKDIFMTNAISFNDTILLTSNDLIEMGIKLGPRKRLLTFSSKYNKYAKDFSLEELKRFFKANKGLVNDNNTKQLIGDKSLTKNPKCTKEREAKTVMNNIFNDISENEKEYNQNENQTQNIRQHYDRQSSLNHLVGKEYTNKNHFKENQVYLNEMNNDRIQRNWSQPNQIVSANSSNTSLQWNNLWKGSQFNQNAMNKTNQMKQSYNRILLEIEAFQEDYLQMKMKASSRNNSISNIRMKTDVKHIRNSITTNCYSNNICNEDNNSYFPLNKQSLNDILSKKQKLKNMLNECQESINHKRLMIKQLDEEDE